MRITLRKANAGDIEGIYTWRNDPRIRKWMFASARILWKTHVQFWKNRLKQRNRYAYIIQADNKSVGLIRLDPDGRQTKQYAIDIYIDPHVQGKGIGKKTMQEVKKIAKKKRIGVLVATVKPDNRRSQKIFEKNGFFLRHYEYVYKV